MWKIIVTKNRKVPFYNHVIKDVVQKILDNFVPFRFLMQNALVSLTFIQVRFMPFKFYT